MSDSKDSDQLSLLMQYTCYHMVIFVGIMAALASNTFNLPKYFLPIAGVFFVASGISIGIIASHIPYSKNFEVFKNEKLFFCKFRIWFGIENYAFWAGITVVFVGLLTDWTFRNFHQ